MRESRYIPAKECAVLVRAALKKHFPGIKFSVKTDTYSMGASVDVKWMDGPTTEAVNAVVKQFEGSTFDGMQDLKSPRETYLNGERVSYGADHVMTQRDCSEEFTRRVAQIVCDRWGEPMPHINVYNNGSAHVDPGEYQRIGNSTFTIDQLVYQELVKTDARTKLPAAKPTGSGIAIVQDDDQTWYITGDTYPKRKIIGEAGAKWDKVYKRWVYTGSELPQAIKDLVNETAAEPTEQKNPAEHLRKLAEDMQPKIDDLNRPRLENTYKRQREAESRRQDRLDLELTQDKLRALADAWNDGSIPDCLKGLTTRAQVERLALNSTYPTPCSYYGEKDPAYDRMVKAGIGSDKQYTEARYELLKLGNQEAGQRTQADELHAKEAAICLVPIPGFFPTPADVVTEMIERAGIEPGMSVLEPSAGKGDIADQIRAIPDVQLDVIEYSRSLIEILQLKGYTPISEDFIEYTNPAEPVKRYDRVLMNPPFEDGQDIDHVRRAYRLLKPGGRLVAIMSESGFYNQNSKSSSFRDWLTEVNAESTKLEQAFKYAQRPTGVAVRVVRIDKPDHVAVLPLWSGGERTFTNLPDSEALALMYGYTPANDYWCIENDRNVYPADNVAYEPIKPIVYLLPANVPSTRREQLKARGNAVTKLEPLPYHALVCPDGYTEMWIPHADGTYPPSIPVVQLSLF